MSTRPDGAAGLLERAQWIMAAEPEPVTAGNRPAYEFRRTFSLQRDFGPSSLAATAHGIYEAFINGVRVGDQELTPGLTTYAKTLYVQHYDVSGMLRAGENELRLIVSDGWYRGRCGPNRVPDGFGTHTAVIAQLNVETPDGMLGISTDLSWEVGVGAITAADLMDGQTTDFTRLDSMDWTAVLVSTDPNSSDRNRLRCSPSPPVRRIREYRPVSVHRLQAGRQIVDLGQNINGWVRLKQLGPAGTRITLTHGEALDHEGDLTMAHLAYVQYPDPHLLPTGQIDTVVSRGQVDDIFEPRHTTHGFRYIAVDGLIEDLHPDGLTGILVHTDLHRTGTFACSDDRVNELHRIAVASWRANACDVPTDCPQRERWGYTGDYQVFIRSAAFLDDVSGFSRKWLRSLSDEQLEDGCITNVAPNTGIVANPVIALPVDGSAGWGDSATIVPWQLYRSYGDPTVLAESFEMMRRWVDYAATVAATERHAERANARSTPAPHERYLWDAGFHWGEWSEPGGVLDFFGDKGIVATAYLHRSAEIVARSAAVLGFDNLVAGYREIADSAADAWRTEYLDKYGRLSIETQASYVRGLSFGLIPEHLRAAAAQRLVELIREKGTHLSTGFLSTPYLLPTLADHGYIDVAYELLLQDSGPSWMTMLARGATTIWESWEGIDSEGNPHESLNHYSKGAVINFLHEYVAGIRADEAAPGYARFTIAPQPGGQLRSASASLETPNGTVASAWSITGNIFNLSVEVPPGSAATVILPSGRALQVVEGRHEVSEPGA